MHGARCSAASRNPSRQAWWILCILMLCLQLGCVRLPPLARPAMLPGTLGTQAAAAGIEAWRVIEGTVDLGLNRDRQTQATIGDVARGATVSLIEVSTGNTIATTLTQPNGSFSLTLSRTFMPRSNTPYFLEAVRGLGLNAPGQDAVRVRTIVVYRNFWQSLTSIAAGATIAISPETTAIAVIAAYRTSIPVLDLLGCLTAGQVDASLDPPTSSTLTFIHPDFTNAEFHQVSGFVNTAIEENSDPLYRIRYNPTYGEFSLTSDGANSGTFAIQIFALSTYIGGEGSNVEIFGDGFATRLQDHIVTFNGVVAPLVALTENSVTARVPAGATSGQIQVKTASGKSNGLFFTVLAGVNGTYRPPTSAPTLASLSPGAAKIGDTVTVTGTGFNTTLANGNVIFLGGRMVARALTATSTSLTFQVPVGVTSGPLQILSGAQPSNALDLAVGVPVVVGSSVPSAIPGSTFTLVGMNFSAIPADNTVTFGSVAGLVTAATPTTLTVTLPPSTVSGPATVRTSGGTSLPFPFGVLSTASGTLGLQGAPVVTAMSPSRGPVGMGVTIAGTGFSAWLPGNRVWFGAIPATVLESSATSLFAVVPVGASTGPVTVVTAGGSTSAGTFTVRGPAVGSARVGAPPAVTTLDPPRAPVGGVVRIAGSGFDPDPGANRVSFNGVQATPDDGTSSELWVTVPAGALTGPLTVTHSAGSSGGMRFEVIEKVGGNVAVAADMAPVIRGMVPAQGPVGTQVTLTGDAYSNWIPGNAVTIGGVSQRVVSATRTQLVVQIMPGSGSGRLQVRTAAGTGDSPPFTVQPTILGAAPVLDRASVTAAAPGTLVVLEGSNFDPDWTRNQVSFGGTIVTPSSGTPAQLVVEVPAAGSSGNLTVSHSGGTSGALRFDVVGRLDGAVAVATDRTPVVTAMNPTQGPVGTEVVLSGDAFSNWVPGNTVLLGTRALEVLEARRTSLKVRINAGAVTGALQVVTAAGAGSAGNFTVTLAIPPAAPTVTAVSPAAAIPGTLVTISGTGFDPDWSRNTVSFAGTSATPVSGSTTRLVVAVPAGAGSGNLSVTQGAGTSGTVRFDVIGAVSGSFRP